MNESLIQVFNKILSTLQANLPQWAFVSVLVGLLLCTVLAAIPLLRNYLPSRPRPQDTVADYRGSTIHVTVQKEALGCNGICSMLNLLHPPNATNFPGASHYVELKRIAALIGDDDEELTIS